MSTERVLIVVYDLTAFTAKDPSDMHISKKQPDYDNLNKIAESVSPKLQLHLYE